MDSSRLRQWQARFPNLRPEGFEESSPQDEFCNCIAHAAGVRDEWWTDQSPDYRWPGKRCGGLVEGAVSVFESLGYRVCPDAAPEPGYVKVAIYQNRNGFWTHAARQEPDGRWLSKDGPYEDVTHASPECVCPPYGSVHCFMRAPLPNRSPRDGDSLVPP